MTPWSWYAGYPGETYDIVCDAPSREKVIAMALRELKPGERFQIIEARASDALRHEGSDCVPFLRTRNHEILTAGEVLAKPTITQPGHLTREAV